MNATIDQLGTTAARQMMDGASEWLLTLGRALSDNEIDAVVAQCKALAPTTVDMAMRDARQAIEAGMAGYASATFAATMRLSGIRAAKIAIGCH